jgi:transmembrane sensor
MREPADKRTAADTEAAEWFARLGTRSVSAPTLEDFRAWRSRPENAAAYGRLEAMWRDAGKLADDPHIREAAAAASARRPRTRVRSLWRVLLPLSAATSCLVIALVLWPPDDPGAYATAVGEQRVVRLADGSTVRLDTSTRLRVRFASERRRIELERGRALFTVAHDPSRPFIVEAGAARATAVGTVFAVRRDRSAVTVTVLSGRVDVAPLAAPRGQARRLLPGHQAVVAGLRQDTRRVDVDAQTSWTEGRLVFRETPLGTAVAEVNRYLADPVALDAGRLAAVPVSGVFRTGDRDAFVAAASELFGLEAVPSPDGSVTLAAKKNPPRPPGVDPG